MKLAGRRKKPAQTRRRGRTRRVGGIKITTGYIGVWRVVGPGRSARYDQPGNILRRLTELIRKQGNPVDGDFGRGAIE